MIESKISYDLTNFTIETVRSVYIIPRCIYEKYAFADEEKAYDLL
jgi:hypothetical protein